jgi:hypothetical protein
MTASIAGRSSSAILFWLWPSRVRRPASLMMIWKTPASAIPCSLAISGGISPVSLIAVAMTLALLPRPPLCRRL